MRVYNPYTHRSLDYPINLSPDNIVLDYYITHETFFCPWFTSWLVVQLQSGDTLYIPYGEKNRRDIYVVTSFYLNHEVQYPHGVFTMKFYEFMKISEIDLPDVSQYGDDDDDDILDDSEIINALFNK